MLSSPMSITSMMDADDTDRIVGFAMLDKLRANRWLTLVTLSLGVALIVIDGTIVNVALPVIIRDLHLNFTDAQWVTTIYALVFAGLLITTGRLADRFGRRRLFAAGVALFVASSVFAGLALNAPDLLVARVFQGVGGALILPSTLSTVNATFFGRDRAIAFGVWGSVISGMAAVGPLLGGWLTTDHSWRWIFYVNVPVGAVLLVGIALFVPETRGSDFAPGADIVGFLLSTFGLATLVFGLVEGGTYGWWRPTAALHIANLTWPAGAPISAAPAGIALGLALLATFVAWEKRRASAGRSALMELGLYQLRSFRWGNTAVLVVSLGEFGLLFALPLYLQNALGLSALGAGYVLVALAAGALTTGGLAALLAARMRPVSIAVLGLALESGFLLVLALAVGPATPGWLLAIVLFGYGAGLGLASAQLTGVTLADVSPAQSGQGSATQSMMRQVGSALGVAILGTILGSSMAAHARGALSGIAAVPQDLAARLEGELAPSAGSIIPQIRSGAISVPDSSAVASAFTDAFADATRMTLFAGAAVLALGLVAALLLRARPSDVSADASGYSSGGTQADVPAALANSK